MSGRSDGGGGVNGGVTADREETTVGDHQTKRQTSKKPIFGATEVYISDDTTGKFPAKFVATKQAKPGILR